MSLEAISDFNNDDFFADIELTIQLKFHLHFSDESSLKSEEISQRIMSKLDCLRPPFTKPEPKPIDPIISFGSLNPIFELHHFIAPGERSTIRSNPSTGEFV